MAKTLKTLKLFKITDAAPTALKFPDIVYGEMNPSTKLEVDVGNVGFQVTGLHAGKDGFYYGKVEPAGFKAADFNKLLESGNKLAFKVRSNLVAIDLAPEYMESSNKKKSGSLTTLIFNGIMDLCGVDLREDMRTHQLLQTVAAITYREAVVAHYGDNEIVNGIIDTVGYSDDDILKSIFDLPDASDEPWRAALVTASKENHMKQVAPIHVWIKSIPQEAVKYRGEWVANSIELHDLVRGELSKIETNFKRRNVKFDKTVDILFPLTSKEQISELTPYTKGHDLVAQNQVEQIQRDGTETVGEVDPDTFQGQPGDGAFAPPQATDTGESESLTKELKAIESTITELEAEAEHMANATQISPHEIESIQHDSSNTHVEPDSYTQNYLPGDEEDE